MTDPRETERALLGAVLLDASQLPRLREVVTAADFFAMPHARTWGALCDLADRGQSPDLVVLLGHVGERDGDYGGASALANLPSACPSVENAEVYAQRVADAGARRRLADSLRRQLAALEAGDDLDAVLAATTRATTDATPRRADGWRDLATLAAEVHAAKMRELDDPGSRVHVHYGLRDLDRLTDGMRPGDLVVVGARPGMGKSAFALNVGLRVGSHGGVAGFVSMEMLELALAMRALCALGPTSAARWRDGSASQADLADLTRAVEQAQGVDLHIVAGGHDVASIARHARALRERRGRLDLLVVDYLQLVKVHARGGENREVQVASIARGLKDLGLALRVPVMALSQLNRSSEARTDKRPGLADLRESGELEQAADTVVFLHRDDYYDPDAPPGVCEAIVAKQRDGQRGTVRLAWRADIQRFDDLDDIHEPARQEPTRTRRRATPAPSWSDGYE